MELSLPPFPAEPGAQGAMAAAVLTILISVTILLFARPVANWWGFAARAGRDGAIGELRPAAAMMAGLGVAGFLFDQPAIYVMLASAWGMAAFGRLLSMMSASDRSNGIYNFLFLLLQAALSAGGFYWLFDVWTGEAFFEMPTDPSTLIVFWAAAALGIIGLLLMFAPGLSMMAAGLATGEGKSRVIASVRSFGGFVAGAALVMLLSQNPMCELALGTALFFSSIGRLASLIFERGRYIFQILVLVLTACGAGIFLSHVFGYF